MTLEQRVKALEVALANQQNEMKKAVSSAIQSAMRPGGCLYTALRADEPCSVAGGQVFIDDAKINVGAVNAAQNRTAKYESGFNISII